MTKTHDENQGNFMSWVSGAKPCGSSHEASSNRQFAGLGEGSYRQLLLPVVVGHPSWQKSWSEIRQWAGFYIFEVFTARPWKDEGCKTTSFWDGKFSAPMLNFQGVRKTNLGIFSVWCAICTKHCEVDEARQWHGVHFHPRALKFEMCRAAGHMK